MASGATGQAEVVRVEFNPKIISYNVLLEVFFELHDPTSLNRQDNDVGKQYRSIILYTSQIQKKQAEKYIKRLEKEKTYDRPIVTEVVPLDEFFLAENEQLNYYAEHANQPYCRLVISPKLDKLRKKYHNLVNIEDISWEN